MNNRVLVIGDIHFPYHHKDTFKFLKAIKTIYKPDRVISIGDEIDGHAWSYHESSTELDSPGQEFIKAKKCMKELESLFPKLDILESNHGSLHKRKQQTHQIPSGFIRSYNEAWEVSPLWKWHYDLTIRLSNGQDCYFHHSRSANIIKASQAMGENCVFGHHHNKQSIEYWTSGRITKFGAFTGCLVDVDSLAYAYGRVNLNKPLLGSLMILEGEPKIIRMNLDNKGNWDKKL